MQGEEKYLMVQESQPQEYPTARLWVLVFYALFITWACIDFGVVCTLLIMPPGGANFLPHLLPTAWPLLILHPAGLVFAGMLIAGLYHGQKKWVLIRKTCRKENIAATLLMFFAMYLSSWPIIFYGNLGVP